MPNQNNTQSVRLRYLEHLGELRLQLETFLALARDNDLTLASEAELRECAQHLKDIGTIYGLVKINYARHNFDVALMGGIKPAAPLIEPIRRLIAACAEAVQSGPEPSPPSSADNLPLLLVVDDDETIREFVHDLLQNDAHILSAANTKDALDLMKYHQPNLVILDNTFTDTTSGMRLLRDRQSMPDISKIPVIIVSASNKPQDVESGLKAGAVDYITKPFEPAALLAKILGHLKRSKI